MFDLLLRARVNHLFKARSANRDAEADFSRTASVFLSIENALKIAEAEHSGLDTRMQDVLARGAISLGNATDEYLTREPADTIVQDRFDREIQIGQLRLVQGWIVIDAGPRRLWCLVRQFVIAAVYDDVLVVWAKDPGRPTDRCVDLN